MGNNFGIFFFYNFFIFFCMSFPEIKRYIYKHSMNVKLSLLLIYNFGILDIFLHFRKWKIKQKYLQEKREACKENEKARTHT